MKKILSLFLSKKAKKVYGVEIIPQAIDNAWINAKENNVENVEFFEVVLKTKNHGENRYKLHYQINVPVITDVNALNF